MATTVFPAMYIRPEQAQQPNILGQLGQMMALRQQMQLNPIQLQTAQQQQQSGALALEEQRLKLQSQKAIMDAVAAEYGTQQTQQQQPPPAPTGQVYPQQQPPGTIMTPLGPQGPTAPGGGPAKTEPLPTPTMPTMATAAVPGQGDFLSGYARVIARAQANGALPSDVLGLSGQILQQQDMFAKMSKTQQDMAVTQNKNAGELANRILNAADMGEQSILWNQAQAMMKTNPNAVSLYGADIANFIANNPYPGPAAIGEHMGMIQGRAEMLADQQKALEVKKTAQDVEPFPEAQRLQYNAAINDNFLRMTGKPAPQEYLLQPGANKQQLDNINNMGKVVFESPQVKARIAGQEAWARVGPAVEEEVRKQKALAIPLGQLARTTISGQRYIDASDLSPQSAAYNRQQAAAAGIPVVDAATADVLRDIDTAKANQNFMLQTLQNKLATNPASRLWYGPANTLEKMAQTDPDLSAVGTYRNAAIQSLRAVAGSKGLRINQKEIQMAIDNDIPNLTDTLPVAMSKLKDLNAFLDNAVNSHLMVNRQQMLNQPSAGGGLSPAAQSVVNKYTQQAPR